MRSFQFLHVCPEPVLANHLPFSVRTEAASTTCHNNTPFSPLPAQAVTSSSYGCASQSGELCPLPPGGWDADPSSSTQVGLGAEILPLCPETCRECPGWEGDARTMWGIVWLTSVTSPLCVWACLPYLRGRRTGALAKQTHTFAPTHTCCF